MDFLKDFKKSVEKIDGVTGSLPPPRYWHSFGNYVLNYIMSGSFRNGVPQGRLVGLAGPSGSGKSYILGNLVKNAQLDGAMILIVDSEEALDDDYMRGIGVDVEDDYYMYNSVTTFSQAIAIISTFIKMYKKEYNGDEDAPKVFIAYDSLDMCLTDTELENYQKQKQKGDQGQRNKQMKAMLRTFVQDIKGQNISMAVTSQVYKNQDLLNGEGLWIVSDAVRYSLSQIALFTKKKLKDSKEAGTFAGIRLNASGFKTRFTKPFQKVEVEVPYDTGINPYSGLMEAAESVGVVVRSGSWYKIDGTEDKRQSKNFDESWYEQILSKLEGDDDLVLASNSEDAADQLDESATSRRKDKHSSDEE
jgi:RecA/RadA recombinase